jgi:hypothetical protein
MSGGMKQRLEAAAPDLLNVAKALLLFHSSALWGPDEAAEWRRLTGTQDSATTKSLCDFARAAIARAEGTTP